MKSRKAYFYSLIAPVMVVISINGFILRAEKKRIFYLPIGIIGIYLIFDKEIQRRLNRKNILEKIKFFQKSK
tara:strand:- start:1185 stop:1400 length:216 start_codon:yes stop_codon:yes gene_type:complete